MAAKTWGGGTGPVDGLWSTATNWTGDAKPGIGDDVTFDGTSVVNCDIDENTAALNSLTATIAYTGILDGATSNKNVIVTGGGNITLDCTRVDMGNGTWTCSGNFDDEDVATINSNGSTLVMNGVGKTLTSGTAYADRLYNITITSTIGTANSMSIGGILAVSGVLTLASTINAYGDTKVIGAAARITGASILKVWGDLSQQDGTIDCSTIEFRETQFQTIIAAQYDSASAKFYTTGGGDVRFTGAAGTYVFTGNVSFPHVGGGDYAVDNSVANSSWEFRGDLTITVGVGTFTWIRGTGTIRINGSGNQDLTTLSKALEDIIVNSTGGTVTLQDALSCNSFTLSNGDFDPNGQNITTTNDFTIGTGGQISVPANLNGATWTVGGNLTLTGEVGDLLDLVGTAAWYVTVAGIATAYYCDFAFCDASGGNTIGACLCTNVDSGDNVNVTFAPVIAFFTATPSTVARGSPSTLAWSADSCMAIISAVIDQGVGAVAAIGSVSVNPTENTTYTLTVTCPTGVATAAVTVGVGQNQADFMRRVLGRYRRPRR